MSIAMIEEILGYFPDLVVSGFGWGTLVLVTYPLIGLLVHLVAASREE